MKRNFAIVLLLGIFLVGILSFNLSSADTCTGTNYQNHGCPGCQTTHPNLPRYGCGTGETRCSGSSMGGSCFRSDGYWTSLGTSCTYSCGGGGCTPNWGACSPSCGPGTQSDGCGNTRSCNNGECCSPVNAVCDSASSIVCGVTQSRAGSCGGSSCSVTGTLCPSGEQCLSNVCVGINHTYWASLSNPSIQINNSNKGDTVLMVFGGSGLSDKNISYEVQHYSGNWIQRLFNNLRWVDFMVVSSSSRLQTYNGLNSDSNYRFNASVVTTSIWNVSNNLTVSGSSDSNPDAHIILPTCKNWSAGYNIPFTQDSTDEDDLLKITWDFADGNTYVVNNYSTALNSTKADTTHNYSSSGSGWKNVLLNAEEMTRSKYDSDSVRLLILQEGINVVPVITSPAPGFNAEANQDITFNASGTYVVNCSNSLTSFNFTTCDGLRCRYVHAPGHNIGQNLSGYTLLFNWTMGDGKFCDGSAPTYCGGNWSSVRDVSRFTWRYQSAGRKNILLRVTYDA